MGLFTASDLEGAIGKNGIEQLKSIAVDKGTAFLSNKTTSAFVKIGSNSTVTATTKLAASGIGAVATASEIYTNAEEIATTLGQKIILKATEIVSKEATECIAGYTKKHLTEISKLPASIAAYTMTAFNENKMSVGDAVKQLLGDSEEDAKKQLENSEKNSQKQFISNAKEKINKISENVTKYTSIATEKIGTVVNYIEEGPDWVIDQLDKQCQSASDYVNKLIDDQWAKDKEKYNSFAKSQGESIGFKMATQYNTALLNAQKKILDKQNVKISAAKTKAKTTILGNLLSIAAKTGIL